MYATNELKKGVVVEIDGEPHVVETTHVSSPSARGGNTIHRIRLRNLKTGQRIDKNFRSGEMIAPADVERRPIQFLYADQDSCHFMDSESFEQFAMGLQEIEWERNFLVEGLEGLRAIYHNNAPLGLELPTTVTLAIQETMPGVRGNSATSRTKPATLETGYIVQVPEHIEPDTKVSVDTRTGEFLGRAKG
jgi:elongation factor P